jgi:hypothetical protein
LAQLQSHLLDLATDPNRPERANALETVSAFYDAIAAVSSKVAARDISAQRNASEQQSSSFSGTISASPSVKVEFGSQDQASATIAEKYTQVFEDTVIFSEISASLERVLDALGLADIVLLIDEWTTIPVDIQPYVAEFLKRTIIPTAGMSLKIGSLRYNSVFSLQESGGGRIGFEFGGAISQIIDLDDHYTFGSDTAAAAGAFTDLLWLHLVALLPGQDYLMHKHGAATPEMLRQKLFAGHIPFGDLMGAASGVVRDFLSIFTIAYFRAAVAKTDRVEVSAVRDAARIAFESSKLPNLSPEQEEMLYSIAQELRMHNSESLFMLDKKDSFNATIQALFDSRVIHILKRGHYGSMKPAGPLTVYSLDYGVIPWMGGSVKGGVPNAYRADLDINAISPPLLHLERLVLPSQHQG